MSEKWGRTGRVELAFLRAIEEITEVFVDGDLIGFVEAAHRGFTAHPFTHGPFGPDGDAPSRDAAVCYVLRRAAPDVWRAERPVVAKLSPSRYDTVEWMATKATLYARAEYARTVAR